MPVVRLSAGPRWHPPVRTSSPDGWIASVATTRRRPRHGTPTSPPGDREGDPIARGRWDAIVEVCGMTAGHGDRRPCGTAGDRLGGRCRHAEQDVADAVLVLVLPGPGPGRTRRSGSAQGRIRRWNRGDGCVALWRMSRSCRRPWPSDWATSPPDRVPAAELASYGPWTSCAGWSRGRA